MKLKAARKISNERMKQLQKFISQLDLGSDLQWSKQLTNPNEISIIDEALTHTSAQEPINHERLEFLGDAVLRLAASEFIDYKYPTMEVGERSALRAQLVSDQWLAEVGHKANIEKILKIGPKAAGDSSARKTLEAEATEALIGALFECFKSLEPIHNWLSPHWIETSQTVLQDPHRQNCKSALQEWTQGRGLIRPSYKSEERSQKHGDKKRFFCTVHIEGKPIGEGWGGSIQDSEKAAARAALKNLSSSKTKIAK